MRIQLKCHDIKNNKQTKRHNNRTCYSITRQSDVARSEKAILVPPTTTIIAAQKKLTAFVQPLNGIATITMANEEN